MKDYSALTVGEIVADDFKHAKVFDKYKIDFCCNGSIPLTEACRNAHVDVETVIGELHSTPSGDSAMVDFKSWPTDLLVDYILKFHHRNIRKQGPEIAQLLQSHPSGKQHCFPTRH